MALHIVILAAGQGKRMCSNLSKVLHAIAGKPMLARVIEVAQALNPEKIHVIVGENNQQIREILPELAVNWVLQDVPLGTGHAVLQALPHIPGSASVLVLSGDVPLIQVDTLRRLTARCEAQSHEAPLGLLLATTPTPYGLGRILRNAEGHIQAIIEEKDATPMERQIQEIYTGICCAKAFALQRWLPKLNRNNAQGEYYLTEIIVMALQDGCPIVGTNADDLYEIQGVNTRQQLQTLEREWQRRYADRLMLSGVTLADAARIDIRGELHCAQDVFIDVNCVFSGKVVIGEGCVIGPNCVLTDVTIGASTTLMPCTVLEKCSIGNDCHIGPFARVRPGTQLADDCKIGNFVETKNAVFAEGSKASHLSYLGDVTIGKSVNIGAGTITCNYDGVNKHQTVIEDGAFIGSDTQLVAPVTVGAHATIGAGSTIRKNVPAGELTLTSSKQVTIPGWQRPKKK